MSEMQEPEERPMTAPSFQINVCGLEEDAGRRLAKTIGAYVNEFSRYINLERLDGITVAMDYATALADLDRGYETSYRLTASMEMVQGVAMTPMVRRDGVIKSHIVLNAEHIYTLIEPEHEYHPLSMHLLAHECSHVELNMVLDKAFPDTLLQKAYDNVLEHIRGSAEVACWDEYAACRIAAPFGRDPKEDYVEAFLAHLEQTEDRANDCIRAYRLHSDHDQVLREVSGYYTNLLKSVSYLLGHLDGKAQDLEDVPAVQEVLEDHWFAGYVSRLQTALRELWKGFGKWQPEDFDAVGDIAVEVLKEGGIEIYVSDNGEIGFHAPYSLATMPS